MLATKFHTHTEQPAIDSYYATQIQRLAQKWNNFVNNETDFVEE